MSLSRPVIAAYGLIAFQDEPLLLSATLGAAFLTDAIDGNLAKWYNRHRPQDQQSRFGRYIDLVADRMLQLGALWIYYAYGAVPLMLPLLFTLKDAVFDPVRVSMDLRSSTPHSVLGEYNRGHRVQTLIHGIFEAVFVCGIPLFADGLSLLLGLFTAGFGYYRGVASIRYARRWAAGQTSLAPPIRQR